MLEIFLFFPYHMFISQEDLGMIFAIQIHTGLTDGALLVQQQRAETLIISLSRWEGPSAKNGKKKSLAAVFHTFALLRWYGPKKLLLKLL